MRNKALKNLKVLLVEDEENLAKLLKSAIGDSFYRFIIAKDGDDGYEKYLELSPDIIITDIMMPNSTGLEMAKNIREKDSNIPIIILSAFSETDKFLNAIDVGVIKYFIKPFDPDELLEYITSIAPELGNKIVNLCDGFTFNKTTNSLYKNNRFVSLSKNEIKFLASLTESRDKIVEDSTIKILLWGEEVSDERLRTFIRRFRTKTSKDLVLNIKGQGYQVVLIENI